jgi:uncharacterized phage protein (TIGR01671 family)
MNSRQFKFRAWDNTKLNWVDVKEYSYTDLFEDEKYIIQQFTGEYDKNNNPIYEGDIVKCERPEIWLQQDFDERDAGIITYFNAGFHIIEKYTGKPIKGSVRLMYYRSLVDPYRLECEVIGNIFENEEILK